MGQSFTEHRTAYSTVKKSFHLSQGSDERHELMRGFLWRMWLRGLGGWAGWGGGGVGCEASGRGRGGKQGAPEEGLFWGQWRGAPRVDPEDLPP